MRRVLSMSVVLLVSATSLAAASSIEPKGAETVHPFNYRGVRLDGGLLMQQLKEVEHSYLGVSNDSYLKGFRRRAGFSSPGKELSGWYEHDIFHPFGQVISGLSRLYAATGDPAVKEKVIALVSEWGKCIEPDGYFFYSRHPNSPHYIYDKMVGGLVDAHLYCDSADALKYLDKITGWAEKNLDRSRLFDRVGQGPAQEWYTLGENLYRAYLLTDEKRYCDFAKVWEYTEYWAPFRNNRDILKRPGRYHAYSHVNTFSSAAMAYRVSGDREYLDTIIHAYDYLQKWQDYATGGYGPGERLLPAKELVASLDGEDRSFETQCGSWAGFKLSKYLIAFTGESRFGDWVEALAINGLCASLPMNPQGHVTYYSEYGLDGGEKVYSAAAWPCCAGTRIQAVPDLTDLIYFHDDDALYVNLFTPSTCDWPRDGQTVAVQQITRFPEEPKTRITIVKSAGQAFSLKLRNPSWLSAPMRVRVNGAPVVVKVDRRGWVGVDRKWRDGDVVDVQLPMALRAMRFPAASNDAFPAAITYGPTVLAFDSPEGPPGSKIDFDHLHTCLVPVKDHPVHFQLASDSRITAQPLYAYAQGVKYYLYLNPGYTWQSLRTNQLKLSGEWNHGPLLHTRQTGARLECQFTGTAVRWVGKKFDDAGQTELVIDDRPPKVVDQYAPGRGSPFRYVIDDLPSGQHTLSLCATGQHDPRSSNTFINVQAVEIEN
jgi:DUF1680 family protein